MSIEFSDNFNAGSPVGWTSNTLACKSLWGFDKTYCVACNESNLFAKKTLGAAVPDKGSIRIQCACILTATDATDGALILNAQDEGAGTNRFQLLIYLLKTGAFRIRWNNNGVGVFANTTETNCFPLDGTQFGLQVRFEIAATNTATFTVNNVDVATLTFIHSSVAFQWQSVFCYGYAIPTTGSRPPYTSLVSIDNYEADNDSVAVDWPAGNAQKLDLSNICVGTTVTGMVYNCSVNQITITGTGFIDGVDIVLEGPDGSSVAFTQNSISYNQITITPTSYPGDGAYCVTVSYPA